MKNNLQKGNVGMTILIIVIILILAGVLFFNRGDQVQEVEVVVPNDEMVEEDDSAMMEEGEAMEEEDAMAEGEAEVTVE